MAPIRALRHHEIPAVFILLILSALLIRGTQELAVVNSIIVVTKVAIVPHGDFYWLEIHASR